MGLPELVRGDRRRSGRRVSRARCSPPACWRSVDGVTRALLSRRGARDGRRPTSRRSARSCRRRAASVPLWSGEWGYSTYDPAAPPTGINYLPAVTRWSVRPSYAARMLLTNHALGLAGSVYFKDRDAAGPEPGEHRAPLRPAARRPDAEARLRGGGDADPAARRRALSAADSRWGRGITGSSFGAGRSPSSRSGRNGRPPGGCAPRSADARIVARDGRDITPVGFEKGLQIRILPDDGPIYLVGDVNVLAPSRCAGDCRGDGAVSVDELAVAVGIALGAVSPLRCAAADTDEDGEVTVDEIVDAVHVALRGCSLFPSVARSWCFLQRDRPEVAARCGPR